MLTSSLGCCHLFFDALNPLFLCLLHFRVEMLERLHEVPLHGAAILMVVQYQSMLPILMPPTPTELQKALVVVLERSMLTTHMGNHEASSMVLLDPY